MSPLQPRNQRYPGGGIGLFFLLSRLARVKNTAEVYEMMDAQKKEMETTIDTLMDLALYSDGTVSFNEIKSMSPMEVGRLQLRLEKYYKEKAKASGNTKEYL